MLTDESYDVSSEDDVSIDTAAAAADKTASDEPVSYDRRGVGPTFRLGKRRGLPGSVGRPVVRPRSTSPTFRLGRRSGEADRRSTTFRLGRRSPYNSFLMNYHGILPGEEAQSDADGLNQPRLTAADSTSDHIADEEWWPIAKQNVLLRKKNAGDNSVLSAAPSSGAEKRDNLQPTFRLGRASPSLQLEKRRLSSGPTFRLGKRDSKKTNGT